MTLTGNQLPPPRGLRPWSGLERRLRDVGISGRTLVIAAPALWLTVFFIIRSSWCSAFRWPPSSSAARLIRRC
jgi:hypothetical protein